MGLPPEPRERHKGCTASGSPSLWPNFKRGSCSPVEPARCAENAGSGLSQGWGRPQAAFSSTPGPQEGIPELPGGSGGGWPPAHRDSLPAEIPRASADAPRPGRATPLSAFGALPGAPFPHGLPSAGLRWALAPPPSSSFLLCLFLFLPFLPSSEPHQRAHLIFLLLFHPLLLPGGSDEEGSPEGGMWGSL